MEAAVAVGLIQLLALLAAVWLSARRRLLEAGLPYLVSVAVGVLLATAVLHILPEAVGSLGNRQALWFIFLATIFALVSAERVVLALVGEDGFISNAGSHPGHAPHATRPFSLVVGGMLHSFMDGLSVATAFAAGRKLGWLTAAAITLHEVPHRMGDYAVLTHLRVGKTRSMQLLVLIGVAAAAGVLLVVALGHALAAANWLLPISAASFVYVALVSMVPELGGRQGVAAMWLQVLCMVAGAGVVAALLRLPLQ